MFGVDGDFRPALKPIGQCKAQMDVRRFVGAHDEQVGLRAAPQSRQADGVDGGRQQDGIDGDDPFMVLGLAVRIPGRSVAVNDPLAPLLPTAFGCQVLAEPERPLVDVIEHIQMAAPGKTQAQTRHQAGQA